MINSESKLNEAKLKHMSDVYDIDINIFRDKLPSAEMKLFQLLQQEKDLQDAFET